MLRYAVTAALVLTTAPAFAGDQSLYPHTHGPAIIGSKTVPFNYRPVGEIYIVRTGAYDADATKLSGRNGRQAGRSQNPTGDAVTEIFVYQN
jgi:hypothetical protein